MVADTPVTISRDNALKSQITKLLASIQNKAVSDTPLDDKEKALFPVPPSPSSNTYLVDPQMLGVSNSMIYQLTDYIGYDILLQYIQELIQQARAMVATGIMTKQFIEHINDNMNDATRQIAAFQSQVQVQQGCAAGCRSSDELHASAAFRPHAQSLPEQLSLRRSTL